MEVNTQLWVDRMAKELGILMSNNLLLNIQVEEYATRLTTANELIEGLKTRVLAQTQDIAGLREMVRPTADRNKTTPPLEE